MTIEDEFPILSHLVRWDGAYWKASDVLAAQAEMDRLAERVECQADKLRYAPARTTARIFCLADTADQEAVDQAQKALDDAVATSKEQEARLNAIYEVDQAMAATQFAGSGITVNITGQTRAEEIAEAVVWALKINTVA